MVAKRDARLRGIGVAVGAKGLLDITFQGKPSAFRGASNCDFDSPQDGFDLACDWDYAAGEDKAAERDLATMVGRLNACLPSPLKAAVPVSYSEAQIRELGAKHGPSFEEYLRTNRKLGQLDASYPVDENWDVTLNVSLSFDRNDRNGSLEISVSFSRYWRGAAQRRLRLGVGWLVRHHEGDVRMHRISRHPRLLIGCLAAACAVAVTLPAAAQGDVAAEAAAPPTTKGEQRLAKLLAGRVAGEPVNCIRAFRNLPMQTIDRTAYVYGSGSTIWVQRTRNPQQIDDDDVLVVNRRDGSQLCRQDFSTTIDRFNGFFTGAVILEDFVPYTRVKPAAGGAG